MWHLYSKVAAREIKQFNPDARIIIMLRNPADKIHSSHSYALYSGVETIPDLETALEAEEYRRNDPETPIGVLYKEAMNYTEQVQRYAGRVWMGESTRNYLRRPQKRSLRDLPEGT